MSIETPVDSPNPEIIHRQTANYHPSVWGDFFMTFTCDDTNRDAWCEEAGNLKEKVRIMLKEEFNTQELGKKLGMVDAIQRLGIGYHFEDEIAELLNKIYKIHNANNQEPSDLLTVAMMFRLLRQHGINVSCGIFSKFKDDEMGFKKVEEESIEGILCLYEASYLRVHGEKILEEALEFTKPILESKVVSQVEPPYLGELVKHALRRPLRKALPRVASREYISIYQQNDLHNQTFLKLAKIDFNLLQMQYIKELRVLTRWWKDLELKKNFPFTRDRITEAFLWAIGVYYEPQYELGRNFFCKVVALSTIVDDIYDVYGTPSEMELFTQAVQRWDCTAEDELPAEYMKIAYRNLLKVYREMEEEVAKEGRSFAITYPKEGIKRLTKAYLEESKWLTPGSKFPSMGEYLKIALVTTGYSMLSLVSIVGMGEKATKEAFDWFMNEPPIIDAAKVICRFMDDIVSHQFERKRKHVPSAVECYMNEHKVEASEAYEKFNKHVENAWLDINGAFLDPKAPPEPLLTRVLNLSRFIEMLYKEEDGYTHPQNTKHLITALFVTPLQI